MQYFFRLSHSKKTKIISLGSADHSSENQRLRLVHSQLLHSQQQIKTDTTFEKNRVQNTDGAEKEVLKITLHIPLQLKLLFLSTVNILKPSGNFTYHQV
jgi:hypothetical protein